MTTLPEVQPEGRLELTWTNKRHRLLSHEDGSYEWTVPGDYRTSEVRLLHSVTTVGEVNDESLRAKDNLLIRGDALHALTSLAELPEFSGEYEGKVKLVYIDPPFNTGQAFADYDDSLEHSVWLTMMRDRLQQIKSLLAPDGSVWLHLDDVEIHRARAVLDEVFGPANFVATVVWQKVYNTKTAAQQFSTDQDYILVYSRQPGWKSYKSARTASMDSLYRSRDGDSRPWRAGPLDAPGAHTHQGSVYAIQSPFTGRLHYPAAGRHWGMGQDSVKSALETWGLQYETVDIHDTRERARRCGLTESEVRAGVQALMLKDPAEAGNSEVRLRLETGNWPVIWWGLKGTGGPQTKIYIDEVAQGSSPQTWWTYDQVGHNQEAKREIQALFPDLHPFNTPKPERLLQRVLSISTQPGDIVLDCFAGSGTTAAVAHKMGRRWVTVEWAHKTIESFTLPRLQKVVNGTDPGGITSTTHEEAIGELPSDVEPADVKRALSTLNKLQDHGMFDDVQLFKKIRKFGSFAAKGKNLSTEQIAEKSAEAEEAVVKAILSSIRQAGRTEKVITTNWTGGGGFRVLDVGPSMFDVEDNQVLLANWAEGDALGEAVAGQYGFTYENNPPFCGRKRKQQLAVIDGLVNDAVVDFLLDWLEDGEILSVFGTGIDPETALRLGELSRGSSLRKIPDSIVASYRRARRRDDGLNWVRSNRDTKGETA